MKKDDILKKIIDYYLNSLDFNGLPIRTINLPINNLKKFLTDLIKNGDISLVFPEQHPNPHVKCLKPWDIDKQIKTLSSYKDITHVVAYPEGEKLLKSIKPQRYSGKPYRLIVAKGKPSLDCAFFKLEVLEQFRNDPRYYYQTNDIVGAIYNHDAVNIEGRDSLYIQSVGFAYDKDMNRAVCIFYTDLMNLNKEQQQYWKHYEITGNYKPHPGFILSQVYGDWDVKASLPEAFTEELKTVNIMTFDVFGKKLFKEDYTNEKRPKELSFLIRPTEKEFEAFIHVLDKLIAENINEDFFNGFINPHIETVRKDGKIVINKKGSLQMLEEFIRLKFRPKDKKPMDDLFRTLRSIRKQRQKPAHAILEDKFDMSFFKRQRRLLIDAYTAVRFLRLILQNHPKVDMNKIPDWLYKGDIYAY